MKKFNFLITCFALALILPLSCTSDKPSSKGVNNQESIVSVKSAYNVKDTADNFENILKEKGLKLFTRINHSENAKAINKELRPTELVIFGNPLVGTPLMQCSQTTGIDLPQKALIWEDESGNTWFSYNNPKYIESRHNITGEDCSKTISKVNNVLSNLAEAATAAK